MLFSVTCGHRSIVSIRYTLETKFPWKLNKNQIFKSSCQAALVIILEFWYQFILETIYFWNWETFKKIESPADKSFFLLILLYSDCNGSGALMGNFYFVEFLCGYFCTGANVHPGHNFNQHVLLLPQRWAVGSTPKYKSSMYFMKKVALKS